MEASLTNPQKNTLYFPHPSVFNFFCTCATYARQAIRKFIADLNWTV
jgi:hypothetical protein